MTDTYCYVYEDALYLNITNRCDCDCLFCLRHDSDGGGYADNLWLKQEPTVAEVLMAVKKFDLQAYREMVFCGYGEPTMCLDTMLEVAAELKKICDLPLRLNTNGHASLVHQKDVPPMLAGLFDVVSVSLNAPEVKEYTRITRPLHGESAFQAMLDFTRECAAYIPLVQMTVVKGSIAAAEMPLCEQLAITCHAQLRIRDYIDIK